MENKDKIYRVETLVAYKMTYYVRARNEADAEQLVQNRDYTSEDTSFDEFSQRCIGEHLMGPTLEVTEQDVLAHRERVKTDSNELGSHWLDINRLIARVKYE